MAARSCSLHPILQEDRGSACNKVTYSHVIMKQNESFRLIVFEAFEEASNSQPEVGVWKQYARIDLAYFGPMQCPYSRRRPSVEREINITIIRQQT